MSRPRIDLVSPPFHGHLHPIMGLGQILRKFAEVRVLTTPDMVRQIEDAGFRCEPILGDHLQTVWSIADTPKPLRGNPWRLWRQFRENLALMEPLRKGVSAAWDSDQPDLVVADFTLPAVGHWAQARGIRWWTSHPSPLAIETPDGTPSYCGGWNMPKGFPGQVRDAVARRLVRLFKRTVFALHARELRAIGLPEVYRRDGSEAVYSNELILALGAEALEFPATWPAALRFIGPMRHSLGFKGGEALRHDPGRKNVLVTIGTHLTHARLRTLHAVAAWATQMPDVFLHYTMGGKEGGAGPGGTNWQAYAYIDYQQAIGRFDAVVHHGGAGITYHCLSAAKPAVVLPIDYDQFDFAARIDRLGLGRRCSAFHQVPSLLRGILADFPMQTRLDKFSADLRKIDSQAEILRHLIEHRIVAG